MRKKFIWAASLGLLAIAGCGTDTAPTEAGGENATAQQGAPKAPAKDTQTVVITDSAVSLNFPKGWYENPDEYPYDVQYFSNNQRMNTGVFLYNTNDFASAIDAEAILELQVEDLSSKRENFTEIQPLTTTDLPDKIVTTTVFSGEKDTSAFYYKFTVVEFKDNPELLAVTLQVAFPSEWDKSRPILEEITQSLAIAPSETPESTEEVETPEAAPETAE
ncbi:hypothetical protein [[Limnothrix rosea] IAM M-220]|uniref:hypothetical protein n=1 Tax=[Limnothrix rosea] IAM M-220 TaxID=454133 RepID=UPI000969919A|nr:hypothetical protein [[Limnothrix rosea] IAM M-220]OKH17613.1 hypothetical protein NIES208_08895 [[Limnothrix rosea] IAM M-220]